MSDIIPTSASGPWRLSELAAQTPTSSLAQVFNHGFGRQGLLPLWVGEGDMPTPAFICEAAAKALRDGETFYTRQRGIPPLREGIAAYMSGLYGQSFSPANFFVTIGGMHALQLAARLTAGPGDEIIIPTPAWPNFLGAFAVNGSIARCVEMTRTPTGYRLDIERLAEAVGPRTRAICINSPSNPTGWTASREEQEQVLALARRHGLWIIADEIYGRFYYDGHRAPSFHDIMDSSDRILFVQTFSKNWAMTGWRIGWLEAPEAISQTVEDMIQYSTSGVPTPLQHGAVAALAGGEAVIRDQVERARQNRDYLVAELSRHGDLFIPQPSGAFYLFFGVSFMPDSRQAAMRIVDEGNVGLAPGSAFGPGGEGFLRLCYLRKSEDIREAVRRLDRCLVRLREASQA